MADNQVTILQVLPRLVSGGVERGTIEMAEAIVARGWRAIVVSGGGAMEGALSRTGALHIKLPVNQRSPFAIYRNIGALERVIEEHQVSLVHARSRAPAWAAYYAAKRCKRPFVTTFHGFYGLNGLFKRYYNSVMTRGDKVIAISEFIREHILRHYHHCPAGRIEVIHRGADLRVFSPEAISRHRLTELAGKWHLHENHTPVILMPGRLTRWKGQHVFIEALAKIKEMPFLALLVGDDAEHPTYREELGKQIEALGLAGKVRFAGKLSNMTEAYALSDIVVSASIEPEAFGRVAVEAQAMGKIVIATNHGGACETVVDRDTGLLVPPSDAPAMAAALKAALTLDTETREEVSRRAIAHIRKHFSIARMQDRTIALYESLL